MYSYQTEKPKILTDEGQREFLKVRDKVKELLKSSGCFRMDKAMPSGDSWVAMAMIDRLVELGEIAEINQPDIAGQHRIFIST